MNDRLLAIVGPTASGKTRAAVDLAMALGGPSRVELVGADSVQIYQRLAIGSARPSAEELQGLKHHMVDLVPLGEGFDAARFVALADEAIREIRARGRLPLVVGGAGLYLRALVKGLAQGIPSDPALRQGLHARIAAGGREELARMHAELTRIDPEYAAAIHPSDPVRVLRALEVWTLSGVTLSEHHRRHRQQPSRYEVWWVGIETPRDELKSRIARRTREMLDKGWIDEVREILAEGYPEELKALQSVGYSEVVDFLRGKIATREELERAVLRSTVAFAKRQRTWFRSEPGLEWRSAEAMGGADFIARAFEFLTSGGSSA